MRAKVAFKSGTKIAYFASTAQPRTQSDDIWARWPAKSPCHLFSFDILTKVNYDKGKLSEPKPDTKTPKKPAGAKNGERVPPTRQWCHPRGFRVSYVKRGTHTDK